MYSINNMKNRINISDNLKFLFNLNKQKNNQKKIDFCRETGISQTTITTWLHKNVKPTGGNLKTLTDYFNKWLSLSLTIDALLHENIEKKNYYSMVKEEAEEYAPDLTKKLIEQIQRLSTKGKKTILDLLKDFE